MGDWSGQMVLLSTRYPFYPLLATPSFPSGNDSSSNLRSRAFQRGLTVDFREYISDLDLASQHIIFPWPCKEGIDLISPMVVNAGTFLGAIGNLFSLGLELPWVWSCLRMKTKQRAKDHNMVRKTRSSRQSPSSRSNCTWRPTPEFSSYINQWNLFLFKFGMQFGMSLLTPAVERVLIPELKRQDVATFEGFWGWRSATALSQEKVRVRKSN